MLWSILALRSSLFTRVFALLMKLLACVVGSPTRFGIGKYCMMADPTGLIRLLGITFPANGVRMKPPAGLAVVVVGSNTVINCACAFKVWVKSPCRSIAVGTLA